MKALPFPCPICGRPAGVPNAIRCHTGKRRYRVCTFGHRFTTFQPFDGEEKPVHLLDKPAPLELPGVDPAVPVPVRPVAGCREIHSVSLPKFAGPWDERMHREWLAGLVGQVERG